jgi:hypothetical protein
LTVLGRREIIAAIRIRKLLEQADSEPGPASATFRAKALDLARNHPRGAAIMYRGKPLLGDDDA